jgi:hypothetical protein
MSGGGARGRGGGMELEVGVDVSLEEEGVVGLLVRVFGLVLMKEIVILSVLLALLISPQMVQASSVQASSIQSSSNQSSPAQSFPPLLHALPNSTVQPQHRPRKQSSTPETALAQTSLIQSPYLGAKGLNMCCAPSGKTSACLSVLPEDHAAITRRDEPQQHIRQQHPHRILHADDTRIALGVLRNVHFPKNAESDQVAQEHECVEVKEEPRLDQRKHECERHKRTQSAAYHAPHPFTVNVHVGFARAVKVDGVEPDDGDAEHELEEA